MIFSIAINFIGGITVAYFSEKQRKKLSKYTLWVFVAANVLMLVYYKYLNFFVDILDETSFIGHSSIDEILLPIGISFFTFQGLSYLIDVYYEKVNPQKNLVSLALYISMFPQLIAGPIVRYIDVEKQIKKTKHFHWSKFSEGIERLIIGLFKKVIIANQMAFIADFVFNSESSFGMTTYWLGIICYSFQIYFDFSGYSDMAIGLGKMFGYDFLENFRLPYISKSIQEFWRRWHISLSSWFRDYLYIPLGGNRKGGLRTYINLSIVFFVTGFWHGASLNFIVWGLYHGLFLILERLFLGKILEKAPKIVSHIYTLLVIMIGWVLFRANTLKDALHYLDNMFSFTAIDNIEVLQYFSPYFIVVLILAFILSTNIKNFLKSIFFGKYQKTKVLLAFKYSGYILIFIFCLLELGANNYNPFIYFRF
ncbi:MBOAT family O-acyltransferase [Maribacter sp. LLG6340-A2]|uniref:MBOAT family O-acyltransferase n=1 Tax=Maribacter sp. LLG6340-A2 TaxID=3160834 RepID=UPI00386EEC2A